MRLFVRLGSLAAAVAIAMASGCSQTPGREADLAVFGRVWTGNPQQPWAEAVAVSGDRILKMGDQESIRGLLGPQTRVVEIEGSMIVPGFIDSHIHFLQGGQNLDSVQLRDASNRDEFASRIEAYAKTLQPGEWVLGGDWDHENWGGELPRRDWIDAVTPDNPVMINRLDGHMALANGAALRAAGIGSDTPDVEGGAIVRDEDGGPTGIFKDNAMSLIAQAVPPPDAKRLDRALDAAMEYVARQGVTSVHDMDDWESLEAYRRARRDGRLKTRIYSVVQLPGWQRLRDEVRDGGRGDEWLRIGGLKAYVDGSLGSHTAAFFEPFSDAPQDRGLLVNDPEDLYRWISGADKAELHVIVHAIGDRAISNLLDIYTRVARENGSRDRRFRMEHAQHIAPKDLPRFADLQVIASMQPYHAIDDGRWADKVIGPQRCKTTYAFRSLLDHQAVVAFGSDWHVAPPTPLEGIYAAVTRRTLDGRNPQGWVPEQKIGVEDALAAYTRNAAFASFEEGIKGSLEEGKLADFVVLDRDLTQIPPEEIRKVQVSMTFVGGKSVHALDSVADLAR